MNTNTLFPRIFSFALAALVTGSILAGIDTLANADHAAASLLAQGSAEAVRPL